MAHIRTLSLYCDQPMNIVYVVGTDILINSYRYDLFMICCSYSIQKMCRSSGELLFRGALLYSSGLKHLITLIAIIDFHLISETSFCIFVLSTG